MFEGRNAYHTRDISLDSGLTALALRALHEREGHYPFVAHHLAGWWRRWRTRRQNQERAHDHHDRDREA